MDTHDTKEHEDSQGKKVAECVRKMTDVINNQMINPFTCEEQDLLIISMGHKATSADSVRAHEKGLEALAAARKTDSEKVAPIKLATFTVKPPQNLCTWQSNLSGLRRREYSYPKLVLCA